MKKNVTFANATAMGVDENGVEHMVTVVVRMTRGRRSTLNAVETTNGFNVKKEYKRYADVEIAYAISHVDDVATKEEGVRVCMSRLKSKEAYLTFTSDYRIPPIMLESVAEAEATRISNHLDGFMRKITDNARKNKKK